MSAMPRFGWLFFVTLLVLLAQTPANVVCAQQQEVEEVEIDAEVDLITRVYPVADLVFSPPNYPFQGVDVSGSRARGGSGFGGMGIGPTSGMGGMGGTGMGGGGFGGGTGGGGGMGGGGQFNVQDGRAVGGLSMNLDDLIETITTTIDPTSWDEVGGAAPIAVFRNQLIIAQTEKAHGQIATLLADLRKQAALSTITVRATWLSLSAEQFASLTPDAQASSPPLVDRAALAEMSKAASTAPRPATAVLVDAGEITCFNGQTVHIVSGRFRGAVTSVIPVVGQVEESQKVESAIAGATMQAPATSTPAEQEEIAETVLAQVAPPTPQVDSGSPTVSPYLNTLQGALNTSVGYQPIVSTQHSGIMLEVTPIAMPGQDAIVLDLRSIVSQWQPAAPGAASFGGITQLDQSEVISQQLATTIRLPIGKPVVAGGLTLEPGAANGTGQRLYLVVEAVVEGQK